MLLMTYINNSAQIRQVYSDMYIDQFIIMVPHVRMKIGTLISVSAPVYETLVQRISEKKIFYI